MAYPLSQGFPAIVTLPGFRGCAWKGGFLGVAHRPSSARPCGEAGSHVSFLPPFLPRSHMEPGFFQHGGTGNRHVWLGRAAPHPPFSWIPRSRIPLAPFPLLTVPSARPLRPPAESGLAKSRCGVAKTSFNSVTSSAQTCCRPRARPSAGCAWNLPLLTVSVS